MGIAVKPKTPKKINANVKALIKELGFGVGKPKYLNYTHRSPTYRATYCFNNCEDEAENTVCEVVYGWMIWEDKKAEFIEAEFHSVIKEDGKLIDISPRQTGEDKILFITDRDRPAGRKRPDTWYSYTNLKMHRGIVAEESRECEIIELDSIHSELRFV
jgi:hypothetical protein